MARAWSRGFSNLIQQARGALHLEGSNPSLGVIQSFVVLWATEGALHLPRGFLFVKGKVTKRAVRIPLSALFFLFLIF